MIPNFSCRSHTRGAVLFVALILLLLLTLLGVTAMQVTLLQERMSGNYRAQQQAFERSEGRMAEGRDGSADPLWAYDWVSDSPVGFPADEATPWKDWLVFPPPERPGANQTMREAVQADWNQKMLVTRSCGGACPERRGSIVGDDPNKKPRFYVISAQQKDPMAEANSAAWALVQTIYVF